MAKDDEKKEEEAEAKGGGSKKLIMIIVPVLILLIGAGYFLFLKPKGGAAAAVKELPAPKPGAVVALTDTTVNLTDGHFLKFNMTLQPTAAAKEADGSQAMDLAIGEFSGMSMAQLSSAKGRTAAQNQLVARVKLAYLPEGKKTDALYEKLGITTDQSKETKKLSTIADLTGAQALKDATDLPIQTNVYDIYFTEWVMQ
jgi:flagellar FliL protein